MTTLAAHTLTDPSFPAFVNFTRNEDGSVTITLRAHATQREAFFICGHAQDRGKSGRCTPGDDRCNNYCNMAPEKGPMKDSPKPTNQVTCGQTVSATFPAEAFTSIMEQLTK